MKFSIRIAGVIIRIQSKYTSVYYTCKDYLTDDNQKPDIEIVVAEKMIADELEKIQQYNKDFHSLKSAEGLLVHRLIVESLPEHNAFLVHGATVAVKNKAYLFSAQSGTGKSTHIKKWLDNIEDSFVVNGDKTVIALKDGIAYACGTPWCGKEKLETNAMVPLKAIVMMERSDHNRVDPMPFGSIFPVLLEQTFQPSDPLKMKKTLGLMSQLGHLVSFYKFYFDNYKDDALQVSFDALTKH